MMNDAKGKNVGKNGSNEMKAFNFKWKYQKLAAVIPVPNMT